MVVETAISRGDRPGSDEGGEGEVMLQPFREQKGEGHQEAARVPVRR
jgi:hypothetical protein